MIIINGSDCVTALTGSHECATLPDTELITPSCDSRVGDADSVVCPGVPEPDEDDSGSRIHARFGKHEHGLTSCETPDITEKEGQPTSSPNPPEKAEYYPEFGGKHEKRPVPHEVIVISPHIFGIAIKGSLYACDSADPKCTTTTARPVAPFVIPRGTHNLGY